MGDGVLKVVILEINEFIERIYGFLRHGIDRKFF